MGDRSMERILEDVDLFRRFSEDSAHFTEWRSDDDNEDFDIELFWGCDYDTVDRMVNVEIPMLLSNVECETSLEIGCAGEGGADLCPAEVLDICKRLSEAFQNDSSVPISSENQIGGIDEENRDHQDSSTIATPAARRSRSTFTVSPPANSFVTDQLPYFDDMVGEYVTLQSHATFENKRFGVTGRRYALIVDERPEPQERLQAFVHLITDLEQMMRRNMELNDYVQLRFRSNNLNNPFICPVVRLAQFDARVCIEMFENIIQSNLVVDVGDGSFSVDVYHVRLPRGGGLTRNQRSLQEFGKTVDKLLKNKRSILKVPEKPFHPHCAVVALMAAKIRALQQRRNMAGDYLKTTSKRHVYAVKKEAREILEACKLPFDRALDLKDFKELCKHSHFCDHPVVIFSREHHNSVIFRANERKSGKPLYLYHHSEHFDVLTSVPALFNKSGYFCPSCNKFDLRKIHKCHEDLCRQCRSYCGTKNGLGCAVTSITCEDCRRSFFSLSCYRAHKTARASPLWIQPTCERLYACRTCARDLKKDRSGQETNKNAGNGKLHECWKSFCECCKKNVEKFSHLCYLQPINQNDPKYASDMQKRRGVFGFFDLECCLTEDNVLVPNLCVFQFEDGTEFVYKTLSCMEKFAESLFCEDGEISRYVGEKYLTIYSHNGARFDTLYMLKYLGLYSTEDPKVVFDGSSAISVSLKRGRLRFLDSLKFLPFPLKALPRAFGVEESKGYFPHSLNRLEFQNWRIDRPLEKDFEPEFMKESEFKDFESWYKREIFEPYMNAKEMFDAGLITSDDFFCYDIYEEMVKYCRQDVKVLRLCFMKFFQSFYEMTGCMPGIRNLTIASLCNTVWRCNFLQEYSVPLLPHNGYSGKDIQSKVALSWLKFLDEFHYAGELMYAGKNKGEYKIALPNNRYVKVDGIHLPSKKVFEMYGCTFHGCLKCFGANLFSNIGGCKMGDLFSWTMNRQARIEAMGYTVEALWECEWKREVQTDEETKYFLAFLDLDLRDVRDPLNPRDALYGGRVDVFQMYFDSGKDPVFPASTAVIEKRHLKYADVVSLYPYINKYGKYPVGHPVVLRNVDFNYDRDAYFGLMHCIMLPPRDLFIPLLPFRFETREGYTKLIFALCRSCAQEGNVSRACDHENECDRWLEGVWTTPEIYKAMEKGYSLVRIFEVWQYLKRKTGLFADYINCFLKLKQQAAGWPKWADTQEKRESYIRKYEEKEGICLDAAKIGEEKDEVSYLLTKLALNSFWGKMGEEQDTRQTRITHDAGVFYKFLADENIKDRKFDLLSEDTMILNWREQSSAITGNRRGYVVHAVFTTALARLKLYSLLEQLGERIVYCDTDSVVYHSGTYFFDQGYSDLPLGEYLGELTDELGEGKFICQWASGGPKNYGYIACDTRKPPEHEDRVKVEFKCRGVTNTRIAKQKVNFEVLRKMIWESTEYDPKRKLRSDLSEAGLVTQKISVPKFDIQRGIPKSDSGSDGIFDRRFDLRARVVKKDYRLVFDKRVFDPDTSRTYPYGYLGNKVDVY